MQLDLLSHRLGQLCISGIVWKLYLGLLWNENLRETAIFVETELLSEIVESVKQKSSVGYIELVEVKLK